MDRNDIQDIVMPLVQLITNYGRNVFTIGQLKEISLALDVLCDRFDEERRRAREKLLKQMARGSK